MLNALLPPEASLMGGEPVKYSVRDPVFVTVRVVEPVAPLSVPPPGRS